MFYMYVLKTDVKQNMFSDLLSNPIVDQMSYSIIFLSRSTNVCFKEAFGIVILKHVDYIWSLPFSTWWDSKKNLFKNQLLWICLKLGWNVALTLIYSNAGHKTILWPLAKGWFFNFLPSQKLVHLSGYFKHHIGGGQLPKNMYEIL